MAQRKQEGWCANGQSTKTASASAVRESNTSFPRGRSAGWVAHRRPLWAPELSVMPRSYARSVVRFCALDAV